MDYGTSCSFSIFRKAAKRNSSNASIGRVTHGYVNVTPCLCTRKSPSGYITGRPVVYLVAWLHDLSIAGHPCRTYINMSIHQISISSASLASCKVNFSTITDDKSMASYTCTHPFGLSFVIIITSGCMKVLLCDVSQLRVTFMHLCNQLI